MSESFFEKQAEKGVYYETGNIIGFLVGVLLFAFILFFILSRGAISFSLVNYVYVFVIVLFAALVLDYFVNRKKPISITE